MPERLGGYFRARPGAKLGQDVRDVRLHGVARQEQLGGDVRVRPALCNQLAVRSGSARPTRPQARRVPPGADLTPYGRNRAAGSMSGESLTEPH
jgi:hypothetical protein